MTSPLVSVVMPTRDRAASLRPAVQSVLSQTYHNLELIIVDDASQDDTPAALRGIAEADARVRAFRNDISLGAAAARNIGTAEARGELVAFNDDDCIWDADKLRIAVDAFVRNPSACLFYSALDVGGQVINGAPNAGKPGAWSVGTPTVVATRAILAAVGGFDPRLPRLQDFDLAVRIVARAEFVMDPRPLVRTDEFENGISASVDRLRAASRYLLRKYASEHISPSDLAEIHHLLGRKLVLAGLRAESLRHFFRALRLSPWRPRSWVALLSASAGRRVFASVAPSWDRAGSIIRKQMQGVFNA